MPLEILLAEGRFIATNVPVPVDEDSGHRDHRRAFSTWSYETCEKLSLGALREAAKRLPGNVYRCKGVIHSRDTPMHRSVLQVVGKRVDLVQESEWGDRSPQTRIVAIGAHGALDGNGLRDCFDRCVAPN